MSAHQKKTYHSHKVSPFKRTPFYYLSLATKLIINLLKRIRVIMLRYIRISAIYLLLSLWIAPLTSAFANGVCSVPGIPSAKEIAETPSQHGKRHHHPVKKQTKKTVKKSTHTTSAPKKGKTAAEVEEIPTYPSMQRAGCKDHPELVKDCWSIPDQQVACRVVYPADLIDNTCTEFSDKLTNCEAYACQSASAQDPTVKTQWQIVKASGDRCIVSSTTDNIGIKDEDGTPLPITQTCEYDDMGKRALIKRFRDAENRFFHFSTCEHFEGIYNCSFTSDGKAIKDAIDEQ